MTYRQIDKLLRKDGWFLISQNGSHRQYKHAVKPGKVTLLLTVGQMKSRREHNEVYSSRLGCYSSSCDHIIQGDSYENKNLSGCP